MMKKIYFILLCAGFSCSKQYVVTADVVYDLSLSPVTIDADGSSSITVSVKINKDADAAKRKVVLETSDGSFTANGTKTITLDALYENGLLVVNTKIKAPTASGYVVVTAKPETRNPYNDFVVKDSVNAVESIPYSIKLEPSAFSVSTDFLGEIQITGILKNQKNNNVSVKNKVLFEYYVNTPANPLSGRERQLQDLSDENSKVSVIYSPGHVTPGTDFYARCTVLDKAGNKTNITDAILISVIP